MNSKDYTKNNLVWVYLGAFVFCIGVIGLMFAICISNFVVNGTPQNCEVYTLTESTILP